MSRLASYWAKSPRLRGAAGELLTEHLRAAFLAARELSRRIGDVPCLDDEQRKSFWRVVELAAILHDAGKIADGFQAMVKGNTRVWPQRHEVLSLGFVPYLVDDPMVREWVSVAVATHHRALDGPTGESRKPTLRSLYLDALEPSIFAEEFGPIDPAAAGELIDWVRQAAELGPASVGGPPEVLAQARAELAALFDRWATPVSDDIGLAAVLLQGAVTLADHLSSAHGRLHQVQPVDGRLRAVIVQSLQSNGRTMRRHQQIAAKTDGHVIILAPTGSGKTESGLLWAVSQLERIASERGCVPRLFYTLPYLASINAMAERLVALLGDRDRVGVMHSRAGSYYLATAIEPEDRQITSSSVAAWPAEAARKAKARENATRLFRETVRVGTPYQLLRGALAGPVHAGTLLESVNCVYLLDELHAYDAKRLGYVLAAAGLWEKLGGRICVLSATIPDSLIELVRQSLGQQIHLIEGHGSGMPPRHRIVLRQQHLTDERSIDEVRTRIADGCAVLVVANSVRHARELFAALAPTAEDLYGPQGAHLLHSRFRRADRAAIEEVIRERHGTTAAARRGGLLVATQVVEVSLDLDFDVIHTSAAPLEALLQRFGRVNRLGTRPPADVVVHLPDYGDSGRAGLADGVYPAQPTQLAWEILAQNDGQLVDERTTVDWLNQIYSSDWGKSWRAEVEHHRDEFTKHFLTFSTPFEDRSGLEEEFDKLFDGTEAILESDIGKYSRALAEIVGAAGRLVAEDLLIPLPYYAPTRWMSELRVRVVDAEYDPRTGLGQLQDRAGGTHYIAGEIV